MYYIDDIHGIEITQIEKNGNNGEEKEPVLLLLSPINERKWPVGMKMTGIEGDNMRIKTGLFIAAEETISGRSNEESWTYPTSSTMWNATT